MRYGFGKKPLVEVDGVNVDGLMACGMELDLEVRFRDVVRDPGFDLSSVAE